MMQDGKTLRWRAHDCEPEGTATPLAEQKAARIAARSAAIMETGMIKEASLSLVPGTKVEAQWGDSWLPAEVCGTSAGSPVADGCLRVKWEDQSQSDVPASY